MKITIIEDTELEALCLREFLIQDGITVSVYFEAEEGMNAVLKEKPNLVFLDLHMPVLDGFEICKTLKTNPETSHIPIIIITASTRKEDLTKAFDLGADDYLTKPLEEFEVKARLNVRLRNQNLLSELKETNHQYQNQVEEYRQITDQMLETNRRLSETEQNFMAALKKGRDPVLLMENFLVMDCTPAALSLFGIRDVKEITDRNIFGFSPEFQAGGRFSTEMAEELIALMEDELSYEFNWNFINNHNRVFSSKVHFQRITENIGLAFITPETPEEKESSDSTPVPGLSDTIIDDATAGITISTAEGHLRFVNKSFAAMLGYAPGELEGSHFSRFTFPDDQEMEKRTLKEAIRSGKTGFTLEKRLVRKDKSVIRVNSKVSCIYDAKGQLKNLTEEFSAITGHGDTEMRLRILNTQLEEANRQKNQFISILSHDLRSKITEMTSAVQLLERSNTANPGREKDSLYLKLLGAAINNSLEMLDDLLDWGRIITGRAQFSFQKINPLDTIRETLEDLSDNLAGKNIKIRLEHPENISLVADKTMFGVLIKNLLMNAIKFSHPGGIIGISAELNSDADRNLSPAEQDAAPGILYSICDYGTGMESAMAKTLFTTAKLRSTPGTSGEAGTGMGIFICREIIEKHRGEIRAESEKGKGCCIHFTLPVNEHQIKPILLDKESL